MSAIRSFDTIIRDSTGAPVTGASPSFTKYAWRDGSGPIAGTAPPLTEHDATNAPGFYVFTIALAAGQYFLGTIDRGASAAQRYEDVRIDYADVADVAGSIDTVTSRVDVATSTRLAAGSYTAPDNASAATAASQATAAAVNAAGAASAASAATAAAYAAQAAAVLGRKLLSNNASWDSSSGILTIYDDDGTTPLRRFQMLDSGGQPTTSDPLSRTVVP